MKNFLALTIVLFCVASCGFQPLYGDRSVASEKLSKIRINVNPVSSVPDKLLHTFRRAIEDAFNADNIEIVSAASTHNLDVKVSKALASYETQNNTSTRTRISLYVNLELSDISTKKIIYKDKLIAIDSFQVADSPYSSLVSEDETSIRMTKELANEIELRIIRKLGMK